MKQLKHTPGPWQVIEDGKDKSPRYLKVKGVCRTLLLRETVDPWLRSDGDVEDAQEAKRKNEQKRANFRLIEAAPDLLEACKELLHGAIAAYMNETGGKGDPDKVLVFQKAQAAIAKAEGSQLAA